MEMYDKDNKNLKLPTFLQFFNFIEVYYLHTGRSLENGLDQLIMTLHIYTIYLS